VRDTLKKLEHFGDAMVEVFHMLALFVIGGSIVWAAVAEYLIIIDKGHAGLSDILLLFIYLELGAMVGIYFKTKRLPVQFLIYITITALTRVLVIDIKIFIEHPEQYVLILYMVGAVLILSLAALVIKYGNSRYDDREDPVLPKESKVGASENEKP